jgi:perosamine synthetase
VTPLPPTLPAPSGRALANGLLALARPSRYAGELERQLASAFPYATAVAFGTGRAALAAAISMAIRATGRSTVVLPAYTSYSVAAAAAAAGARVRLCDLSPTSLDFDATDLDECVDDETAAVVLGNLFGFPSLATGVEWIQDRGALVIDDAAQALGARTAAGPVGWRGDLGVLSFGRGKCVTTGDAGVLLVHSERLKAFVADVPRSPGDRGIREWLAAVAVRAAGWPAVFHAMSRIPGARIGESSYDPGIRAAAASAAAHGLAVDLEEAVDRHLQTRTGVARMWLAALCQNSTVEVVTVPVDTTPAFLRMPVLVHEPATRARMLGDLRSLGFAYVRSYPAPLGRIEEFNRVHCEARPTPLAEHIANTMIALPCHGGVGPRDIRRAVAVLGRPGDAECLQGHANTGVQRANLSQR